MKTIILFLFIFVSIDSVSADPVWQEYVFGPYRLRSSVPIVENKVHGTDSWVGAAKVGDEIELSFDVGWYSSDFSEFSTYKDYKRVRKISNARIIDYVTASVEKGYFVGMFMKPSNEEYSTRYNLDAFCKTEKSRDMALKIIETAKFPDLHNKSSHSAN